MLPRFAVTGVLLTLACLSLLGAEPRTAEDKKAQTALNKLRARAKEKSVDFAKLRKDILAFRLAHPGTSPIVDSAVLMSEIESPLDRLKAASIPATEKFDWQPKELVAILGEHRGRHGAPVTSVAVSANNSLIASGGGGYVRTWDPKTMRLQGLGHASYGVTSIAISKNNKFLAAGTVYGGLYVWDVLKGGDLKYRGYTVVATAGVAQIAFHKDNKLVACAGGDNIVHLYDVSGAKLEEAGKLTGHRQPVQAVAFTPDGQNLISGSLDMTARVWSVAKKAEVSLINHTTGVRSLAVSASGKTLATGGADGTIRLWGLPAAAKPKAPRLLFQASKNAITCLSFSSSGKTLAVTQGEQVIRLWNVSTLKPRETMKLEGTFGIAQSVFYSPDMKLLVTGGDDYVVRTWDLTRAKVPERFVPWSHLSHVYSVAFAPDMNTLASGSYDRVVRFWDLARAEPRTRNYLKGDNIPIYSVAYSPDGALVAAAGVSTSIRQWDAVKGATRATLKGHSSYVQGITYGHDGRTLLSFAGKEAILFDTKSGSEKHRLEHKTTIHCAALSPDGKHVLTGSGTYLRDKDGKIVVKGTKYVWEDCLLKLWDAEKGEEIVSVKDEEKPFYSTAFSADGKQVLGGGYEAQMRRWSIAPKKLGELTALKGTSGYVHGIVPSWDGKKVFTRGLDGKLILWDLASGKRLKEWTFNEPLGGFALAMDGRHLAVGLGTGVIYILRLK